MQPGQQYGANPGQQWYGQNQTAQQPYGYPPMSGKLINCYLLHIADVKNNCKPVGSRFDRPPLNTSKQALSNMLRQRHPINNYGMPGIPNNPTGGGPAPGYGHMQRFSRQTLRQQHPGNIQSNQVRQQAFPKSAKTYLISNVYRLFFQINMATCKLG